MSQPPQQAQDPVVEALRAEVAALRGLLEAQASPVAFQAESCLAVVDTRYPLELEVARKTKTPLQMADMTEDVRTMSVRLFGVLGSWTQDSVTAVKLARGVKGQNGFELWRLLWVEHTPENESKALSWRRAS